MLSLLDEEALKMEREIEAMDLKGFFRFLKFDTIGI